MLFLFPFYAHSFLPVSVKMSLQVISSDTVRKPESNSALSHFKLFWYYAKANEVKFFHCAIKQHARKEYVGEEYSYTNS
jgi:hypothetical protein